MSEYKNDLLDEHFPDNVYSGKGREARAVQKNKSHVDKHCGEYKLPSIVPDTVYNLLPVSKTKERLTTLRIHDEKGERNGYPYSNLQRYSFGATGETLTLYILYQPPLLCIGHHLHQLEKRLSEHNISLLAAYRADYHEPIEAENQPIITAIMQLPKEVTQLKASQTEI